MSTKEQGLTQGMRIERQKDGTIVGLPINTGLLVIARSIQLTQRFARDFGARTYDTVEALCADPRVEMVYVATPHQHHAAHVATAAAHERPATLTGIGLRLD